MQTDVPAEVPLSELLGLAGKLRECADEVMQFPHPSACDHLHVAHKLMREAADELESVPSAESWKAQKAEIDRLRACLREVLEFQSDPKAPTIHDFGRWRRAAEGLKA